MSSLFRYCLGTKYGEMMVDIRGYTFVVEEEAEDDGSKENRSEDYLLLLGEVIRDGPVEQGAG